MTTEEALDVLLHETTVPRPRGSYFLCLLAANEALSLTEKYIRHNRSGENADWLRQVEINALHWAREAELEMAAAELY